ncbi:MAG TPA: hypothetical protein VIU86_07500, partial [Gaiellaceae bacterium]
GVARQLELIRAAVWSFWYVYELRTLFVEGLALLGTGALLGASVPRVFFLLAAMPPAFNVLVLARVYDVRPALTRLLVVGATLPAVAVVALVSAVR